MNTPLVHSELTLLTKPGGTKLAGEPLLDIGMNSNVVTGEIIPTSEFFRTCRAHKASLALMFDNVVLCESVLASETFAACGILARKASSTCQVMNFCDVTFEFTSSTKSTGAKWTD